MKDNVNGTSIQRTDEKGNKKGKLLKITADRKKSEFSNVRYEIVDSDIDNKILLRPFFRFIYEEIEKMRKNEETKE